MKKLLCITALSLSTLPVLSQSRIGVTIYQNTDRFTMTYRDIDYQQDQVLNFHRISVALSFNLRGKYTHELEIFIPEFSKEPKQFLFPANLTLGISSGADIEVGSYSFRYEIYRRLTKNKPVSFALGAALNPYYITHYTPPAGGYYSFQGRMFGTSLNIIPRVQWTMGKSLLLNLSMPFKIYDYIYYYTHVNNPNIGTRFQSNGSSEPEFFYEAYTVRLGLMWRSE